VLDRDHMVHGPAFPDSNSDVVAAVGAGNAGGTAATPSPIAVPIVGVSVLKGSVRDVLGDLGISDEEADFYENAVQKGATLIVVRTDDKRVGKAERIMRRAFASNVAQLK
jgi:hypothetical protein